MIRAVIFDMDGTLIDTEKYYRMFWPNAMAEFGYSMSDEQALLMRSLGRPFAPAKLKNGRPTKKITSKATIKIKAFKDLPRTYNIFFDNVGLGVTLRGCFPGVKYE